MATSNPCPNCQIELYPTDCERSPGDCSGYGCQECGHGCDYGLVSDELSKCFEILVMDAADNLEGAEFVIQEARADADLRVRP